MQIINAFEGILRPGHRYVAMRTRKGVMVHRFGLNDKWQIVLGYSPEQIAPSFLGDRPEHIDAAKATGYKFPYQFVVGGDRGPSEFDGVVWQCLPFDAVGPHARRQPSQDYVSVGMVGDFRYKPPSAKQFAAATELIAELTGAMELDPYQTIKGHGDIAAAHDGTKAPGKVHACPGDLWDMNVLRDDIARRAQHCSLDRLTSMGIVIDAP